MYCRDSDINSEWHYELYFWKCTFNLYLLLWISDLFLSIYNDKNLYFDKNGNIISINAGDNPHNGYASNNRASRVVLQDGKKQVYLYYNRVHGDFSSEGNYYTKDIDANTPL